MLPEPLSDKARKLRNEFRNGIHGLIAPDVFPVEAAHALTRAERQKIIPVGDAAKLFADLMMTAPQFHVYHGLLARALAISSNERIGVYDCLDVALAEREGCQFITADDRLVNKLNTQFPFIVALSSLP